MEINLNKNEKQENLICLIKGEKKDS